MSPMGFRQEITILKFILFIVVSYDLGKHKVWGISLFNKFLTISERIFTVTNTY